MNPTTIRTLLLIHKWGGLVGGMVWMMATMWLAWWFSMRLFNSGRLEFLWEPQGIFLATFVFLSLSVTFGLLGICLGRQFVRALVRVILSWPASLLGGWKARVRHAVLWGLQHGILNPFTVVALITASSMMCSLHLLKAVPHDWVPEAWTIFVIILSVLFSLPAMHVASGYFFGLFRYLDWVDLLKPPPQQVGRIR